MMNINTFPSTKIGSRAFEKNADNCYVDSADSFCNPFPYAIAPNACPQIPDEYRCNQSTTCGWYDGKCTLKGNSVPPYNKEPEAVPIAVPEAVPIAVPEAVPIAVPEAVSVNVVN